MHAAAIQYLSGHGDASAALGTSLNALLAHLVRASGHYAAQASIGVALGGVLNIALDPLFMFVILPRGQEALGAGIATLAVQCDCNGAISCSLIALASVKNPCCV